LKEPLSPDAATALIHTITRTGQVAFSQHAIDEMRADDLTLVDCVNVLRAGAVRQPADLIHETWRYRIQTNRITVVIAFRSEHELVIVTAWRHKK
jgi:hypothetical protein